MDPDPDPGGPNTRGSGGSESSGSESGGSGGSGFGSGSATLVLFLYYLLNSDTGSVDPTAPVIRLPLSVGLMVSPMQGTRYEQHLSLAFNLVFY